MSDKPWPVDHPLRAQGEQPSVIWDRNGETYKIFTTDAFIALAKAAMPHGSFPSELQIIRLLQDAYRAARQAREASHD